ncbi:MAG: acyltransferase [Haliea sp.]
MKLGKLARRFFVPAIVRTLIYGLRYRAFVSPRAEVDFTPNLVLGKGAVVSAFAKLKATDGPMVIGPRTTIGPGCFISAGTAGITIGADALIAANTVIVANNHRYDTLDKPINQQGLRSLGIKIGNDVWVGANSCVLDGTQIGASAIVNAGSVVSGKVAERMIVSGNPAKRVFERR